SLGLRGTGRLLLSKLSQRNLKTYSRLRAPSTSTLYYHTAGRGARVQEQPRWRACMRHRRRVIALYHGCPRLLGECGCESLQQSLPEYLVSSYFGGEHS